MLRLSPRVRKSTLLAAALAAASAAPVFAQSEDSDLLAPLVDPDADLLAPLVPEDSDLLAPLVPEDDDLLEPLVPKKPRKPGKVTHKDEIEIGPVENGYVLVKRKIIDPCGTFEISWGGRKTCHNYERETWEYVPAGQEPSGENQQPDQEADEKGGGRLPGGPPPGSGGRLPGGDRGHGPRDNGPSKNPGEDRDGNGPSNDNSASGTQTGGGSGQSSSGSKGSGPIVAPSPDKPGRLRDFEVRPVSLSRDPQGRFDVLLTVRNAAKSAKLIANGDWTVTLTDADGLGFSSRDIWMPTAGAAKPFHLMPNVAPGGVQQIRFLVRPEAVRSSLARLSVQQNGAPPATFDISLSAVGRNSVKAAPPATDASFISLHKFDVRVDQVSIVGGKTELFFTARNRTRELQYLGGSNLTFSATGSNGQPVQSRREAYSIRGARGEPTGMAPVQPGASARLRALFDTAAIKAPLNVTDGVKSEQLQMPANSQAAEPEW